MRRVREGDRGGHRTGGADAYAPVGHTHETPALPRWIRYIAFVLVALVLVIGVFGVAVLVTMDSRVDGVTDYVNERRAARDAERVEDVRRTRLLICDLLVTADPPVSDGRQDAIDRLSCPPADSSAYRELED